MARINVYNDGPDNDGPRLLTGWYESTTRLEWVDAGSNFSTDALALTAGGKWVRVTHSGYSDTRRCIWFASQKEASEFLLMHNEDAVYECYFGEIESEKCY